MTHNEWARTIRDILSRSFNWQEEENPEWLGLFIYDLSAYLSGLDCVRQHNKIKSKTGSEEK